MASAYGEGTQKSCKLLKLLGLQDHLKSDCFGASIINGVKKPVLFSFSVDEPPKYKTIKVP